ncbi:o-succinylbenzoate--CoA ligase [Serinicoccus sp. LYQ131]|uniref:o-succinylbenzoate--CoA ligase n=1 Tax=Serinicoccus sp. LYQ131 TaxID=3378797 RepID=UPI0038521BBC
MSAAGPAPLRVTPGAGWADLGAPLTRLLAHEGGAVLVQTSGSTGRPKQVSLPARALRASGEATADVLGGHGQWLLALPTHHVAGLQVLARSVLAGTAPVALDSGAPFTVDSFAAAVARLDPDARRYASLVPTQVHRLLKDQVGVRALQGLDAVLLGGSATDPDLLRSARQTGVRVVTTYGMSETCGGCVYDGIPLPGVQVRIGAQQRIRLGGPVLADGYPEHPALSAERFVEDTDGRWFLTDDRGVLDPADGRLTVLGRVDDVIVTGGHNVEPADVERALRALPQVQDALVVGVEDPEWGHRVAALVVPPDGAAGTTPTGPSVATLRSALVLALPPHALPRQAEVVPALPLLESGKPDRAAARDLLAAGGRMDLHPH